MTLWDTRSVGSHPFHQTLNWIWIPETANVLIIYSHWLPADLSEGVDQAYIYEVVPDIAGQDLKS